MSATPDPGQPSPADGGDVLTEHDWTAGVDVESPGSMRAAISNAMVGLKKRYYGKGPEKARTYFNDNYVFCALESVLTRNEITLVQAGREEAVREYRAIFELAMSKTTTQAVEQITGRAVVAYQSQIVFRPDHAFEIFVLDAAPFDA